MTRGFDLDAFMADINRELDLDDDLVQDLGNPQEVGAAAVVEQSQGADPFDRDDRLPRRS
jgi:hypothetical protein